MNIQAKQIASFDIAHMDQTTALSYYTQIANLLQPQTTLTQAMGTVWTAFRDARDGFDEAFAQVRKWSQTSELKGLDDDRDAALSGFSAMLKAMLRSPNAEKRQAAERVQFVRQKYTLDPSAEYMKETTAIQQMVQEMEDDVQTDQALTTSGLKEWLQDLKAKNEAFLQKMNERTAEQAGQQKGLLKERRALCEAAYRGVVKLVNAMSICEVPEGLDLSTPIDRLNAEVEHYRLILVRGGSASEDEGGDEPEPTPTPDPEPTPEPEPTPVVPEEQA